MPKRDYTIQRRGQNGYERTVVGKDGQTHVMATDRRGRDGHFTEEGQYRRAIELAVAQNRQGITVEARPIQLRRRGPA